MNDENVDKFGELVKAIGDNLGDLGHSDSKKPKLWIWENETHELVFAESPKREGSYSAKLYPITKKKRVWTLTPDDQKNFRQQASAREIAAAIRGMLQ
jgi:hypothetical protein